MADSPEPPSLRQRAGDRAARNATVRAVGELLGRLASLVLFAGIARATGEPGLGVFVFAISWSLLATIPVGIGLDRYLVRRLAADRSRVDEVADVLTLKILLAVAVVAASVGVAFLAGLDPETRAAIALLMPAMAIGTLSRTFHSTFTAHERAGLVAASIVCERCVIAALGLAALAAGLGVVAVAGAYVAGGLAGLAFAAWMMRTRIGAPRPRIAPRAWRGLAARGLPFGAQDVSQALLERSAPLLLAFLAFEAAVGRYGAAYRLVEATFFLTFAVAGAFLAMYTYLGSDTEPTLRGAFRRSIKLSLTVLTPCAVAFAALAGPLLGFLFGSEFESAAPLLRLLAPVAVLAGVLILSSALVVARRSPLTMVAVTGGTVILNIALNLALIPPLADEGAALAMLVSYLCGAGVALALAVRTVEGIAWAPTIAAPALAGAAMLAVMLALGPALAPALAAGALVYVAVFGAVERLVSPGDLSFVLEMIGRALPSRARRETA